MANQKHREAEKELLKILNISRNMDLIEFRGRLEKALEYIKASMGKIKSTFDMPIYRGNIITFEMPTRTENGVGVYNETSGVMEFIIHDILELNKISFIKRVIGVGGDHVLIKNGKVYVNDRELEEVYLNGIETPRKGDFYDVVVPEGYLFVMGDNRSGSSDSRAFGCIPLDKVEGRVTTRIWPLSEFGKIDD